MHHTDKNNLTDEELRELQRKEALSDSEEYDIQDRTYNDGPLTRQYILDETIVGGSELVDEEKKKKTSPPILVVEDESEEDNILIVSDEDPIDTKPIDTTIKEESILDPPEPKQEEKAVQHLKPIFKESEKDYIDRDTALAENEEEPTTPAPMRENKVEKSHDRRRGTPSWIKWAGMLFGFILLIVLCLFLYSYITGYITEKQTLSDEKRAYIELANKTNEIVLNEDDICRDFVAVTENLMLGIITIDEYRDSINFLSNCINVELNSIATYEIVNPEDSPIKAAIIDYLKNTRSIIDLYSQSDLSEDELKLAILKGLNQHLTNRDVRHNNLVTLIYEQADVHEINADHKDQIVMFDIEKP